MSQPLLRNGRERKCIYSTTTSPMTTKTFRRRLIPTVLTRSIMLTCLFLYTWPAVNCEMDPVRMNISMALAGKSSYTNIVEAFISNNLIQELTSNGQPLTLLAPMNAAFGVLPKDQMDSIEKSNLDSYVLRFHVLTRYFTYKELYALNGTKVNTIAGPMIEVTGGLPGGRIQFHAQNGAMSHLEQPDVVTNGQLSVQGISSILVPAGIASPSPTTDISDPVSSPISAPSSSLNDPPPTIPLIRSPPTGDIQAPPLPPIILPPPSSGLTPPFPPEVPLVKYPPPGQMIPPPPSGAGNFQSSPMEPSIIQPSLTPPASVTPTVKSPPPGGINQVGNPAGSSTSTGAGMRSVSVNGVVTLMLGACTMYLIAAH